MADFDDSADPELGEACNRLAAWVEPLPVAAVIDRDTGLTERDLALILRHLHATRHQRPAAGGRRRRGGGGRPSATRIGADHREALTALAQTCLRPVIGQLEA